MTHSEKLLTYLKKNEQHLTTFSQQLSEALKVNDFTPEVTESLEKQRSMLDDELLLIMELIESEEYIQKRIASEQVSV